MWKLNSILDFFVFLILVFSAVSDIKTRKIPIQVILIGMPLLCIIVVLIGKLSLIDYLLGVSIGLFLVIVSLGTKGRFGLGDALMFCLTGVGLGFWMNLSLLIYSSLFACIYAIFICIIKKVGFHSRLPFLPFVLLAFLVIKVPELYDKII